MALDVAILGPAGSPVDVVSLSPDVHARLLSTTTSPLLARMADYYADAAYRLPELQGLVTELMALHRATSHDAELSDVCERMCALVQRAETLGATVVVIAD